MTAATANLTKDWLVTFDCGKHYFNTRDINISINVNKCNRLIFIPNSLINSSFYFKEVKIGKEYSNVNVEINYTVKDFSSLINKEHTHTHTHTRQILRNAILN